MNTIIVHHRSQHHAINSGYGRIIDFIPNVDIVTGNTVNFSYKLAKLLSQRMNQFSGSYDSSSLLKELALYKLIQQYKKEATIVHYLNAERDIRYVVKNASKFSNTFFCGSFHKPPTILKEQIQQTKYLKKLGGAIAVGANQVDFLQEWLGVSNVKYIPHGVDTSFFKPAVKNINEQRILFVGQHLRDFDTFNKSIAIILKQFPNVKVDVVLHKAYIKQIAPHSSVTIYSGINDFELRDMYQKASILFLPLTDVTACNSILEGLACGVPIITTNVGGNSAYLKGSENILIQKSDTDTCIDAISKLLKDDDLLYSIGKSSRLKAMEYDWENVSKSVVEFYRELQK